jgi:deazaflavin-dependent oxidoreductase (nitroreductase family)
MTDVSGMRRFWYVAAGELGTSRFFHPLHRAIYRWSRGRVLGRSMGCEVILLTVSGRKTGQPRTVPIFGFAEGRTFVVVGSNAGKDRHPGWYLNLRDQPEAQLQVGGERFRVRAREATPTEREQLWPRLASQYGGYEVYRARTRREIPVLILERV